MMIDDDDDALLFGLELHKNGVGKWEDYWKLPQWE